MGTAWIDRVMDTNSAIVETEARVFTQVSKILTMDMQSQDTGEDEILLASYGCRLVQLRAIQTQLLRDREVEK